MNGDLRKWLRLSAGALFVAVASIGIYLDFTKAYRFEAAGTITEAVWNTGNHQMSLFRIQADDGTERVLHHHRVMLTADQIKKGDRFVKESRSYDCTINGVRVRCVR